MTSGKLQQIRFISPIGSVGGGISGADLDEALAQAPHFIPCDAGTTDAGPFSLGMGIPAFPPEAVKRDLSLMLSHRECSGTFNLTNSTFEAIDGVTVRIRGRNEIVV